jgi:hypothetical protein
MRYLVLSGMFVVGVTLLLTGCANRQADYWGGVSREVGRTVGR